MCEEKCGCSSALVPVKILTTPPGRSLVAKTSANVTAHRGFFSEARTIQVLPPAITGSTTETKPVSEVFSSAMIATTPKGSGTEKLKCEEATGFTELNT